MKHGEQGLGALFLEHRGKVLKLASVLDLRLMNKCSDCIPSELHAVQCPSASKAWQCHASLD